MENGVFAGQQLDVARLRRNLNDLEIAFHVNAEGKTETYLNGRNVENEIRQMAVSEKVSIVAAVPEVRHALVKQQQAFGKSKGIVMDGRDIGTTVFPDAELKIYVNASPETRAKRRFEELKAKGDSNVSYDEVLQNVKERDRIDTTRTESPLRCADDAIMLDNSNMTIEEQDKWLLDQFTLAEAHAAEKSGTH